MKTETEQQEPSNACLSAQEKDQAVESAQQQEQEMTTLSAGAEESKENMEQTTEVVSSEAEEKEAKTKNVVSSRLGLTPEENKQLRSGARFFHKAMESMSAAQGEHYRPYRIPSEMRAALSRLDEQAVKERRQELEAQAAKEGRQLSQEELEEATRTLSKLHAVDPEEQEELKAKREEEERIAAGGARFFKKYQECVGHQSEYKETVKHKMLRNLKIFGIVIIALAGYMGYNEYFVDKEAQSLSELKSMLPMPIDGFTTLVRIDDRNNNFKMFLEKDPAAYAGLDEHQKNASLDKVKNLAPALCKNQLLYGIIASGKKVTVLLDAADNSFHREVTIEKCPALKNPAE